MTKVVNANANMIGVKHGESASAIASTFANRVVADGGVVESQDCLIDRIQNLKTLGLWDKASAVWMPHGYKEDKLYAVKGGAVADLGFTRNGTRTRKGPTYVEEVPYNILKGSNQFSSGWSKRSTTVTLDPTTNLNLVTCAAGTGIDHSVIQAGLPDITNAPAGIKLLLKAGTQQYIQVTFGLSTAGWRGSVIDLSSMTIVGGTSGATLTPVGNGVYQYEMLSTAFTQSNPIFYVQANDNSTFFTDLHTSVGGGTWYMANAQVTYVESKDYLGTTDRFNVPALDYTNSTCPSLSLAPSRTSICLQSEDFTAGSWTKSNVTVSSNSTNGPDGLGTADLLTNSDVGASVSQVVTISANTTYTISVFLKDSGGGYTKVEFKKNTEQIAAWFRPLDGTIGTVLNAGLATGATASIKDYGNGWYRCILTGALNNGQTIPTVAVYRTNADNSSATSAGQKVYAVGVQVEQGSYATSYIPTTSATVTRIADSVNALTGVSSLIGQTEGTIYCEVRTFADGTGKWISLSDGTANNRILVGFNSGNNIQVTTSVGGVVQSNIFGPSPFTTGTTYKIAVTYNEASVKLFVNGVKHSEDLSATPPATSEIRFADQSSVSPFYGDFDVPLILSKTAISDAQAIALTAA